MPKTPGCFSISEKCVDSIVRRVKNEMGALPVANAVYNAYPVHNGKVNGKPQAVLVTSASKSKTSATSATNGKSYGRTGRRGAVDEGVYSTGSRTSTLSKKRRPARNVIRSGIRTVKDSILGLGASAIAYGAKQYGTLRNAADKRTTKYLNHRTAKKENSIVRNKAKANAARNTLAALVEQRAERTRALKNRLTTRAAATPSGIKQNAERRALFSSIVRNSKNGVSKAATLRTIKQNQSAFNGLFPTSTKITSRRSSGSTSRTVANSPARRSANSAKNGNAIKAAATVAAAKTASEARARLSNQVARADPKLAGLYGV